MHKRIQVFAYIMVAASLVAGGVFASACSGGNGIPDNLPYVLQGMAQPGIVGAPPVDVKLDISLPEFPSQIAVYKIARPVVDDSYAAGLAKQFGFAGNPVPLTEGDRRIVYTYVDGDRTLEVWLNGRIFMHSEHYLKEPEYLPPDEECIAIASEWLREQSLYPDNVIGITTSPYASVATSDTSTGLVVDYYQVGTRVTFSTAIDGLTVNTGGPEVSIGNHGTLLAVDTNVFTVERAFEIQLKDISKALGILKDTLASQTPVVSGYLECLVNMRAFSSLAVNGISLNYHYRADGNYLLPVYMFTGDAYDEYAPDDAGLFIGVVDAVAH